MEGPVCLPGRRLETPPGASKSSAAGPSGKGSQPLPSAAQRVKEEVRSRPPPRGQSAQAAKKQLVEKLRAELHDLYIRSNPEVAKNWIDGNFKIHRATMSELMAQTCRNCLYSAKGAVRHAFQQCRFLGDKIRPPCPARAARSSRCPRRAAFIIGWLIVPNGGLAKAGKGR